MKQDEKGEWLISTLFALGCLAWIWTTASPKRPDDVCSEACSKMSLIMESNTVNEDGKTLEACTCIKSL